MQTAQQLVELANQDRDKISGIGRAAMSALQVHRALSHLEQLGIVKELTAQRRNRLFSYARYVEIISRGTELPTTWLIL